MVGKPLRTLANRNGRIQQSKALELSIVCANYRRMELRIDNLKRKKVN